MQTDIDQNGVSGKRALEQVLSSLGPVKEQFEDPLVQEVMINAPDDVFIERAGVMIKLDVKITEAQIRAAINVLASTAGRNHDAKNPVLNARWPGVRVCAVIPPVALRGPSMAIRKHSPLVFTLEDMVEKEILTSETAAELRKIVKSRKNVLIVGGTSSGKTTFLKTLIGEIDSDDRIITIEDIPELDIKLSNRVCFEVRDELGMTYTELVKVGLRYNPDRFILGEVRDGAALDLLNAANTGHDGCMATLHANSALEGLSRFEDLVSQAGSTIPLASIQRRIATTFHYVVFMAKVGGKRKLLQLLKMEGFDPNSKTYNYTHIFKLDKDDWY